MKHISLFSGIGGFDLASEWMGWQNVASCEINSFGNKVLQYYWPNAYHHDDIKTLTYEKLNQELTTRFGADWRSDDIILTGGFPCQPYSAAGKRLGKEDERHLWPEMLRVIREVKPTWIVGENVLGLVNWSGGLVFEEVQADLEAEGYEVQPFVLPACAVNAPHRRDRVWFVAYSNINGLNQQWGYDRSCQNNERSNPSVKWSANTKDIDSRNSSTNFIGGQGIIGGTCSKENGEKKQLTNPRRVCELGQISNESKGIISTNWDKNNNSSTLVQEGQEWFQLPKHRGMEYDKEIHISSNIVGQENDGNQINRMEGYASDTDRDRFQRSVFPGCDDKQGRNRPVESIKEHIYSHAKSRIQNAGWQNFPTQSPVCVGDDGLSTKLDGITFSKWRNESIKAAGNAIVPQVVYQIFKAIEEYEQNRNHGQDRKTAD